MNTIQAAFEDLTSKAIPPDATETEMKLFSLLFYSGAIAVLAILEEIGNDDISEDAGVAMLENLKQEGLTFMQGVKKA
ncbi:hypothetical protein [Methylobacillus flagellatus]|uniref:hypothetical protein n=1 Tax=Methylobacillus flagellatus TaxID=405 RepID=UPI0002F321D7|nr:hypothetical protein [Methylobacillus flagellatus]